MLSAVAIVNLHDQRNSAWHRAADRTAVDESANEFAWSDREQTGNGHAAWLDLVARQHRANFDLWHIEDEARTPGATDAELAGAKRRIDRTNQHRNDLAEEVDRALLHWLAAQGLPDADAALHSESPGLMIDRLSILALKIYHTREEAERQNAPVGHAERNQDRLAVLAEQRSDLAGCLDELWRETLAGKRKFKLYRQLKMYNDPSLNPSIYHNLTR